MQDAAHIVDRPLAAVQRRNRGDQYVWVVLDVIQRIVVFIVVMGALVGVEVFPQLVFHAGVCGFRCQHIAVRRRVRGHAHAAGGSLHQHGAGGDAGKQQQNSRRDPAHDQKALLVAGNKGRCLLGVLGGTLGRLCGRFGGFDRIFHAGAGFGRSVLLADRPLLLPAGIGVAGKLRVLRVGFLIQRLQVCFVRTGLRAGGGPIGLQPAFVVGVVDQTSAALGGFFQLVRALHAHVVLFRLPELTMDGGQDRLAGGEFKGMGQLGGRLLLFLKGKARRHAPGFRVNDAPFHLFLRDGSLGLFQFVHALFRFADRLFQIRGSPFLLRELQAGGSLAHRTSSQQASRSPSVSRSASAS